MTLFDQLDGLPAVTAMQRAVEALWSLVVRCDTCDGTGKAIRKMTPTANCPAGCVDGWQPSDPLVATVEEAHSEAQAWDVASAVLRLIGAS